MENKNKIIIVVSIIVIISSVAVSLLMLTKEEQKEPLTIEGINLPENKDILKDSKVDELDITEVSLLTREEISSYKAKVSNSTNEDITINKLYVVFYLPKETIKIPALSNITIKSNNNTYINISSETDLSKTTKIEYVME